MPEQDDGGSRFFDVNAIAASLPATAATMLVDHYLTDRAAGSVRVFRVYRPTPPHYHATCDEVLFVLSGRGVFWMERESNQKEIGPGELVIFSRNTVHAMHALVEEPFVLLSVDTPRREPRDIIFVDPAQGSPESFMARNASA